MKNIHLIATDKPTGIFQSNSGLQFSIRDKVRVEPLKGFHIYITSDEEITGFEHNIWVIKGERILLWQNTMALVSNNKPRKIILTTDQDLIKDGVQAIDDEFLEWFVKNPSCESVETYSLGIENSDTGESGHYKYEIIIQQEEQIKCYCGHTSYCNCGPQEETKQDTMKTAVEFLVEEINKLTGLTIAMDEPCVEQAIKMEKEQIMNAYKAAEDKYEFFEYEHRYGREYLTAEPYYNETFKSE
jgi:hypothetical protein